MILTVVLFVNNGRKTPGFKFSEKKNAQVKYCISNSPCKIYNGPTALASVKQDYVPHSQVTEMEGY